MARLTETETMYSSTSAIPIRLSLLAILNVLHDIPSYTAVAHEKIDRIYLTPRMTCDIMVCMTTAQSTES